MRSLELKIPPLVWMLVCALCMEACRRWLPELSFALPGATYWGVGAGAGGIGFAVWGVLEFRRARTTVDPTCPEGATSVVRTGPFRFSRNPMYLGMFLVLCGWGLHLQNLGGLVFPPFFVSVMTLLQIGPEERILLQRFGAEYREFLDTTPRWLGRPPA